MDIITLDFETYYDDEYTLNKMTTEEYVRDERFEPHGFAIDWRQCPDARCEETIWYDGEMAHLGPQCILNGIDWSKTALLCHHTQFDGLILSHHYGIVPALYLDTMSMARALLGTHISKSLESLAKEFGLGAKTVPYDLFKGRHWHELSEYTRKQVADGACQDINLTWDLFCRLAAGFPAAEYAIVDATVRMFTVPRLVGNTELLGQIWQDEQNRKNQMLEQLGLTEKDIRKDWVFAKILRDNGIEPEQKRMKDGKCKVCKGTGLVAPEDKADGTDLPCIACEGTGEVARYKYSFAKTDEFMRELQEHEDDDIRLMAETKLAVHSTGTQTRTHRLGWMSTRGNMCVYLNYCGTHLKGWSGGDKVNWQNFRRGGPIAHAIEAPQGCKVVAADASQFECRLLEEVAGEDMTDWREGKDPYISLASKFYEEEIYKPEKDDPRQQEMEEKRGTGKQLRLSCGYGAGGRTIVVTARKGVYGPPVYLSDAQGLQARDLYRSEKPRVEHLWHEGNDILKKMHAGMELQWGPVYIKDKKMWMPNGLPVLYDTLKWEDDPDDGGDAGWRVRVNRNGWSKLYGAKLVENLIQGLRNVFIREVWLRCRDAGLDIVSMEHDKLVAVVSLSEADAALAFLRTELSRAPTWLPNVPLDSEGFISDTFAK